MYGRIESLSIPPDIIRDYSNFLCCMLHSSSLELEQKHRLSILEKDYRAAIRNAKTMQELREYVTGLFTGTAATIRMSSVNSGGKDLVETVKRYIRSHYAEELSLEKLSQEHYISPSYLSYLFKFVSGESYSDYLKNTRLTKAKELLKNRPELKVYEVCYMVGYKEYKYFSQQFKNTFGLSPTEIRRSKR